MENIKDWLKCGAVLFIFFGVQSVLYEVEYYESSQPEQVQADQTVSID